MNHSFLTLAMPEVKWLDLDSAAIEPGERAFHWEAGWTLCKIKESLTTIPEIEVVFL
jgi:hypothetical protein